MTKRILITSTDVMMYQFLLPHVWNLSQNGYIVDVACSHANLYENEGYHEYIKSHIPSTSNFYSIRLSRSPFSIKNKKGYKDLKSLINPVHYDVIWTNEPVMGVMTRLSARKARKNGTKVLYMAHGYHFYKHCPKKNWLAYPVEKFMSRFCDAICLINWEDYNFTKKHFKRVKSFHIDGIGLDTKKIMNMQTDRKSKRTELGFSDEDILLLSVGELQKRKNHFPIISALSRIDNKKIKYIICGCGELRDEYVKLMNTYGLEDRVYLMGHRYDVLEILHCVDVFIHPSLREGLGIAALEAMSVGLPLITSNVQGIKDYMTNGLNGYVLDPFDVNGYKIAIEKLASDSELRKQFGTYNKDFVVKYDIEESKSQVLKIIEGL